MQLASDFETKRDGLVGVEQDNVNDIFAIRSSVQCYLPSRLDVPERWELLLATLHKSVVPSGP